MSLENTPSVDKQIHGTGHDDNSSLWRYLARSGSQANPQEFAEGYLDETGYSLWSITLSDIMTVVLIFFLVWVTIHMHETIQLSIPAAGDEPTWNHKESWRSKTVLDGLDGLPENMVKKISDNGLLLILPEQNCFRQEGEHLSLSVKGKEILEKLAEILSKQSGYQLLVTGYSDRIKIGSGNIFQSATEHSLSLAETVFKKLVVSGVDPYLLRIQALNSAGQDPKTAGAKNETEDARKNRVELSLLFQ